MVPERNKKGKVNPEWYITFAETFLVGLVLVIYAYITDDIYPNLPDTFSFPFYGFVLMAIGIFSFVITRNKLHLTAIVINAGAWCWTFVVTAIDVFDVTTPLKPFTAIAMIISAAICIRILVYAKDTKLEK